MQTSSIYFKRPTIYLVVLVAATVTDLLAPVALAARYPGYSHAGIFPEDPARSEETISGKIHGIASGIGFIFLILNPLWALWIDEFARLKIVNAVLFLAAILSFVAFLLSEGRTSGILQYTGLFQRLNLFILYSHLLVNFLWQKK